MPSQNEIDKCIEKLQKDSEIGGYKINPNSEDLEMIITGYLENEAKFGYPACPCRLATGNFEEDKDIICPCDYRDDDIVDFGQCYCSLYVDDEIASGNKSTEPIPERRDQVQKGQEVDTSQNMKEHLLGLKVNIWRCPVCGYLCAKEKPPPKCPICGASNDRFELLIAVDKC
jgi:ferredoxin-thioredoxin reductase catalytic subunit